MVIRCYKSYIAYKLYVLGIMMTQNRDTHVQTSMMRWDAIVCTFVGRLLPLHLFKVFQLCSVALK